MALASSMKSLEFTGVAASIQRLFGSCGGAARQDVLSMEEADGPLGGDRAQGGRATYEKAKN